MSNLDGQLKTIFREWLSEDNYSEEKAVELIRLAFTEAGYHQRAELIQAKRSELLTGAEWLDRFMIQAELVEWVVGRDYDVALQAARKAAGLKETEPSNG